MKKNYTIVFAAVTALIVLCAFWGCDSSDDDDGLLLPLAEEASLGNTTITPITTNEQVYKKSDGNPCDSVSPGDVRTSVSNTGSNYRLTVAEISSITANGKLTVKLPVFTQWDDVDPAWLQKEVLEKGFTAVINPPDVQIVSVGVFQASGIPDMRKTNGPQVNEYWYANKDAIIQAVSNADGETVTILNLNLKLGWNSVITTTLGGAVTGTTGRPDSSFKWTAYDD
jgi:hypothetical protein